MRVRFGFDRVPTIALALAAIVTMPRPASSQVVERPVTAERTVTVAAVGRVTREPDRAILHLAVETFASTAAEAAEDNAERMDRLIAALRRFGLGEDKVKTVSYQLVPEYEYPPVEPRRPREQRLVGYRAVNMVQVTIDEIERVGEIIDAAIAAGANRVNGIAFTLRDPDAARQDALRDAVARAHAEAEAIAEALGDRLGPVIALSTTGGLPQPIARMDMARFESAAAAAVTPIEPGTVDVEVRVTAIYRLEP